MQLIKEKSMEIKALLKELKEADALPISDEDLDKVAGGYLDQSWMFQGQPPVFG